MKYIAYIILSIMLISCNAYADDEKAHADKSEYLPSEVWNKFDIHLKKLYLIGMNDGMLGLCMIKDCSDDTMRYLHDQNSCIIKDFNSIYGQNIDIEFALLFVLSLKKCLNKITEEEFLSLAKKHRNK